MKNSEIAKENFKSGYNCAQSVFMTYADKFGINKDMALKLSSSFGGGMGRMREVCGELIQTLAEKFKERNGTIICRELLGLEKGENNSFVPSKRTEEYYNERPCEDFISDACNIIDKYIFEK